jgi:ATP-binding cassette subfamily B protein
MPAKQASLARYIWPANHLGELVEYLARRARLTPQSTRLPQPPESLLTADGPAIGQWIDNAAGSIGLEAEPVSVLYGELEQFLRSGGPAILRLKGQTEADQTVYIGLLSSDAKKVHLLCPDLRIRRLRSEHLRLAISNPLEGQLGEQIDQLLVDAQVPEERRGRSRLAILRDQLGPQRIEAGWLLRLPPGANLTSQFQINGLYKPVFIMIGMYFVQQLLSIASWIVIGRGIFQGHFETSWLLAWALLLFFTIPVMVIVNDAQSELSMSAGALFKQRLLQGTLKLEPEEIRHQGMGQFLGRVMESEAVEMLALSGGFTSLLSFIELGLAFIILARGASGAIGAWSLAFWLALTLFLLWRYWASSREWTTAYRDMTNDLAEDMVGHRTRLIQEDPRHWHDGEDQTLERYLRLSESLDRIGLQLSSTISRGWIIVGLSGLAFTFVVGNPAPSALAIGLGGVLLAGQGLGKLAGGAQSLTSLLIAWQQVGPLFRASRRKREIPDLSFVPPTRAAASESINAGEKSFQVSPAAGAPAQHDAALLMARDLVFRYRPQGRPVLQDCSLLIYPGDRILLEGPSGGGKSTLAAVLTGLRLPESGSLLLWGFDRKILGLEEWRRRVVMAPQFQENYVFSETFAFNLLMGRRWPPLPEDLQEAEAICIELGLGDLIQRMPSGFQQTLGESGWQLSHGERSRLFIARTLLQHSDLVILDESFGALDPENLARAMQCVLSRAETVLVIAHP